MVGHASEPCEHLRAVRSPEFRPMLLKLNISSARLSRKLKSILSTASCDGISLEGDAGKLRRICKPFKDGSSQHQPGYTSFPVVSSNQVDYGTKLHTWQKGGVFALYGNG